MSDYRALAMSIATSIWVCIPISILTQVVMAGYNSHLKGTTYWLNLKSFGGVSGDITSPGTCANRRSTDYDNLSFEEYWRFPENPMDLIALSSTERMAYPESDWTLTPLDCNTVHYERTFMWTVWCCPSVSN